MRFSLLQERGALFNYPRSAPIAQLVEQLICNQWVGSSSLSGGTMFQRLNIILRHFANPSSRHIVDKRHNFF